MASGRGGSRVSGGEKGSEATQSSNEELTSRNEQLEALNAVPGVPVHASEGPGRGAEFRPDLVLCDIGLPGWTGTRWRGRCGPIRPCAARSSSRSPAAPRPKDLARSRQAGFDRHLAKPPSVEKLREALAAPRTGESS